MKNDRTFLNKNGSKTRIRTYTIKAENIRPNDYILWMPGDFVDSAIKYGVVGSILQYAATMNKPGGLRYFDIGLNYRGKESTICISELDDVLIERRYYS